MENATAQVTLTEFLLARIAEDEAAARGHAGTAYHRWTFEPYLDRLGGRVRGVSDDWHGRGFVAVSEHIARQHPARVLAECEAKRRIVEEHSAVDVRLLAGIPPVWECSRCSSDIPYEGRFALDWPCTTIRALAAVYADHGDYRADWA